MAPTLMMLQRDPNYYIADGNIVLLVENTFFKVHRSILIKDNSMFNGMFLLDAYKPDGVEGQEGESDETPIHLVGDTADEFRALMWSLYALPSELPRKLHNFELCIQFCHLGRIAHKYQFQSLESWALNDLTTFVLEVTEQYKKFEKSEKKLEEMCTNTTHITEVAVLCEHPLLLAAVTVQWKAFISDGQCLGLAIDMADRLGMKELLGLAYHAMMLKGRVHWHSLTPAHHIRLLSGFYTITRMCEQLPSSPPPLSHDPCCALLPNCQRAWVNWWQAIHIGFYYSNAAQMCTLSKADLLGRVVLAERIIRTVGENGPAGTWFQSMYPGCLVGATEAAAWKVKQVTDCLADMFADVE